MLFGVGVPTFRLSVDTGEVQGGGFSEQRSIKKASGADVPSRIFLDDECAQEVSAIIFSPWYVKERPERRGHPPGWDYVFALNPHARREFPFDAPLCGRVFFIGLKCDDRRSRAPGDARDLLP